MTCVIHVSDMCHHPRAARSGRGPLPAQSWLWVNDLSNQLRISWLVLKWTWNPQTRINIHNHEQHQQTSTNMTRMAKEFHLGAQGAQGPPYRGAGHDLASWRKVSSTWWTAGSRERGWCFSSTSIGEFPHFLEDLLGHYGLEPIRQSYNLTTCKERFPEWDEKSQNHWPLVRKQWMNGWFLGSPI